MNTFEYWFDYIVRNGEYCWTGDEYRKWILIIGDYQYEAVRGYSHNVINAYHVIEEDYIDDEDAFYPSSFEFNSSKAKENSLLRELRKPRI